MKTKLNIKNFRVFDENGASFELNPITILTGGNNSGKSTVVKAILLLQDFCQQIKEDFSEGRNIISRLNDYKIDFHKLPNSILGTFDNVIHRIFSKDDKTNTSGRVVMEVEIFSCMLMQDVVVRLEFGARKEDPLNNGYLKACSIKTLDGHMIYSCDRDDVATIDFSKVKQDFLYFLYGQYTHELLHTFPSIIGYDNTDAITEITDKLTDILDNYSINNDKFNKSIYLWHLLKEAIIGESPSVRNTMLYTLSFFQDLHSVDFSFLKNSPELNVLSYFPCMETLKDIQKADVRKIIFDAAKSHGYDLSQSSGYRGLSIGRQTETKENIINIFLDEFEESNARYIHEFIGIMEDKMFFIEKENDQIGFRLPDPEPFSDTEVLDYYSMWTTWSMSMLSMSIINDVLTGSNDSFHKYIKKEDVFADIPDDNGIPQWECCEMYRHFMESCFNYKNCFLDKILDDIFDSLFSGMLSYMPATVIQPKRIFAFDDDNYLSKLLKQLYEVINIWENQRSNSKEADNAYQPYTFINNRLNKFGIAHSFKIESFAEGNAVSIRLFENENDDTGMPIADKGVGVLQIFSILLRIEIAILKNSINDISYHYRNSYNLLNCFEDFGGTLDLKANRELYRLTERTYKYSEFCPITVVLEEPEVHLHPKYQSLLADMFVEAYHKYNVHFIIETHSEYLIRKTQVFVARSKYENEDAMNKENPFKVYYVPRDDAPYEMKFCADGRFKSEFGKGFFDEATNLAFEIL